MVVPSYLQQIPEGLGPEKGKGEKMWAGAVQRMLDTLFDLDMVLTLPLPCLCAEGGHVHSLGFCQPLVHILNNGA